MKLRKKLNHLLEIMERYGDEKINRLGRNSVYEIIHQYDEEIRAFRHHAKDRFRIGFISGVIFTVVMIALTILGYTIIF